MHTSVHFINMQICHSAHAKWYDGGSRERTHCLEPAGVDGDVQNDDACRLAVPSRSVVLSHSVVLTLPRLEE